MCNCCESKLEEPNRPGLFAPMNLSEWHADCHMVFHSVCSLEAWRMQEQDEPRAWFGEWNTKEKQGAFRQAI